MRIGGSNLSTENLNRTVYCLCVCSAVRLSGRYFNSLLIKNLDSATFFGTWIAQAVYRYRDSYGTQVMSTPSFTVLKSTKQVVGKYLRFPTFVTVLKSQN